MRVIRPILLLLVAVLALLPFYGGYEAQGTYLELVDGLRMGTSGQAGVVSEFHRGWLRSTAVTRFVAATPGGSGEIAFHHTFVHGPILFGALIEGRLPTPLVLAVVYTDFQPEFAQQSPWKEGLAGRPLVRFRTTLEIGGRIRTAVDSPAIQVETEAGVLAWEGVQGRAIATRDFEASSGVFKAPSLELRSDGEVLRMKGAVLEFDHDTTANGLLEGASVLSLEELSIERPGIPGERFRLRNGSLHATGDEDLAFDTYEVSLGASFDELLADGDRFGPGAVAVALRNLGASALHELGEQLEALAQRRQGLEEADFSPLNVNLDVLPKLVALSPEIVLTRFELASEQGELAGTARIGIDGAKAAGIPMPLLLPLAIEADASIFVPAPMFHAVAEAYLMSVAGNDGPIPPNQTRRDLKSQAALSRRELVDSILDAGYLVREGGGYRIRARFREGQLWLNGRPAGPGGLLTPPEPAGEPASTAFALPPF